MSFGNDKTIPGSVEPYKEGVNILHNGTRIGAADRERAIRHIADTQEKGYIKSDEAEKRIRLVEDAEREADVRALTSDLPAPFSKTSWVRSYDWNQTKYWAPTFILGIALSTVLAIVPAVVLGADRLFPETALGLGIAVPSLIFGFIGFFACLGGIIVKANE